MRIYLALVALLTAWLIYTRPSSTRAAHVTHAEWDGQRFTCPARTDEWVDEKEALAGRVDYVYCIPAEREEESNGH